MRYLKLPNLETGQWCDKDEMMLQACFQLLVDYVEGEKAGEVINWDSDEGHANAWKEISELYEWWKNIRPNRSCKFLDDDEMESPKYVWGEEDDDGNVGLLKFEFSSEEAKKEWREAAEEYGRLEGEWFQEDQKNLHRLIEIRSYMWT